MSTTKKAKPKKETGPQAVAPNGIPLGVTADGFVEHWNASPSLKSFAEGLGISASTCALYAARLRKEGHDLKWFRKGRPRLLKM